MDLVERFEMRITIDPGDIDQMGHVNNVVYLRWVQDVAVAHWLAAAPAVDLNKLLWVVIRHEIDYKQPAFLGDEIIACTWEGTATRITFEAAYGIAARFRSERAGPGAHGVVPD